jgi:hypothetical protein
MFPCLGGLRYWPLTGMVGVFRAPFEAVVAKAAPWNRRGKTVRYGSFDEALVARGPFGFAVDQTVFALSAGEGIWTVVLDSAFPSGDVRVFMEARAHYDLACEFAAAEWTPESTVQSASAAFLHYRPSPRRSLFRDRSPGDRRLVQVLFDATPGGDPAVRQRQSDAHRQRGRQMGRHP